MKELTWHISTLGNFQTVNKANNNTSNIITEHQISWQSFSMHYLSQISLPVVSEKPIKSCLWGLWCEEMNSLYEDIQAPFLIFNLWESIWKLCKLSTTTPPWNTLKENTIKLPYHNSLIQHHLIFHSIGFCVKYQFQFNDRYVLKGSKSNKGIINDTCNCVNKTHWKVC